MTARKVRIRGWGLSALAVLCLLLPAGACRPKDPGKRPLAEVNGEILTIGDFNAAFERRSPALGDAPAASSRRTEQRLAYLEKRIEETLVDQEARRLKIEVPDGDFQAEIARVTQSYGPGGLDQMLLSRRLDRAVWEEQVRMRLRAEQVIARMTASRAAPVTDEECKAYYEAHLTDFARPKEVRARQILVGSGALAEELRAQIRKGADFSELARKHSISPDAARGGDLGFFPPGTMPSEFDRVVFQLPRRAVSEVIFSPYGFHLFRVEEVRQPQTLPLAEVSGQIREKLSAGRRQKAYQEWVAELRKGAKIEIHQELLAQ